MSKRKGEVSKEKILSSAEKLFAANGYHGTKVSDIVNDAGLTQASFYQYFKSKEVILNEIFANFEEQLAYFVKTGQQVSQKSVTEIENYLIQTYIKLFELLGSNKNMTKIVLNEGVKGEELRRKIVEQISENMKNNQILGILRQEVNIGVFAELLVASIERIVHRYGENADKGFSAESLGSSLGEIIFHGVLKKD